MLVSLGREPVRWARRPRVAIITTGDELIAPGEEGRPGAVRDSNAYAVAALAEDAGPEVFAERSASDRPAEIRTPAGR